MVVVSTTELVQATRCQCGKAALNRARTRWAMRTATRCSRTSRSTNCMEFIAVGTFNSKWNAPSAAGTEQGQPGVFSLCLSRPIASVPFLFRVGDSGCPDLLGGGSRSSLQRLPPCHLPDAPDLLGGGSRSSLQRLPPCHLPDASDLLGGGSTFFATGIFPPQEFARNVTIPRASLGYLGSSGSGRRRSVATHVPTLPSKSVAFGRGVRTTSF